MKKTRVWISVVTVLLLAACDLNPPGQGETEHKDLPYFGNHDISLTPSDAESYTTDTSYYTVPAFAFTNQFGMEVSDLDYEGKIYVTDYFFTTCPSICPVMSSQLSRLQDKLKKSSLLGEVKLLSHTVDPAHDTPEVLREYANNLGADSAHWNFVTGNQEDLYDQARHGYFLTALPSDTAAGGFFHSDTFVLIDRNRHIRGYYDGTSTQSVDALFEDIKLLVNRDL